jgi:exonuclease III
MNFCRTLCTLNICAIECAAKKSLLKEFVIENDCDIVFMQEVVSHDFDVFFGYCAIVNIGTAPRGTAALIRDGIKYRDLLLSECGRIISFAVGDTNFINVYPISGAQYSRERRDFFLNEIVTHLNKPNTHNIVLGGDFNCIVDPADTRGTTKNLCHELKRLIETTNMKDVYSKYAGNYTTRQFTFHRGNSASRLDRFYLSTPLLSRTTNFRVAPVCFSDHSAVIFRYEINNIELAVRHGRGYWKINPMFLNVAEINERFREVCTETRQRMCYRGNFSKWWSVDFKNKTKAHYKSEAISFNRECARRKSFFYGLLQELATRQNNNLDSDVNIGYAKQQLCEIEKEKLAALGYKMKSKVLCEDERLNLFHFVKQKDSGKSMSALKIDGATVRDPFLMKQHIEEFYRSILADRNEQVNRSFITLNFITTRINNEYADSLLRPITADEIQTTLKTCTKKKSPGPDGLTYEFYQRNFETVKDDLHTLFNNFLLHPNTVPENFANGIIVLIPKKKNPDGINDYRPISLLNCDYKLFTKILANRITAHLDQIIGEEQSACISDKSCVGNITKLRNLLAKATSSRRLKFAIFSLDMNKAFDRVDHEYLWRCLEKFGFPQRFIELLKNLYKNAKSQVLVNGFLTNQIPINRSVRQGCPLSMVLFVLYIEPLLKMINEVISGEQIGQSTVKALAYADDVCYVVKNDKESDEVLLATQTFCNESGAVLNKTKSEFLRVNQCQIGPQLITENSSIKILGLKFSTNLNATIKLNFENLTSTIKFMLRQNSIRNLNLIQKVWFANTFVLSKLWYVSQVIPPGNAHIAQMKTAIGNFLWAGYLYRVHRTQLWLPRKKGGLALISIEDKTKALFLKNLMLKKTDGTTIYEPDFLFNERQQLILSRNMREWAELSTEYDTRTLVTTKLIYNEMLRRKEIVPHIEQKVPEINWENVWRNISLNHLPTDWASAAYQVLNDIIPSGQKLFRHRISADPPVCRTCGLLDSTDHRVKYCHGSQNIWNFIKDLFIQRLNLQINPDELLGEKLNKNGEIGLWITLAATWFNVKNFKDGRLEEFKQEMRSMRWRKRHLLEKYGNLIFIYLFFFGGWKVFFWRIGRMFFLVVGRFFFGGLEGCFFWWKEYPFLCKI